MKKTHIAALIVIGILIAFIITQSSSYSTYETFETAYSEHSDQEFQVVGWLEADREMVYEPEIDPNKFTFWMKDKKDVVRKVIYYDVKPTDFERSEEVVAIGRMKGDEFHATRMLLKCPSKYIEEGPQIREVGGGTKGA